jgi:hypothetical protein
MPTLTMTSVLEAMARLRADASETDLYRLKSIVLTLTKVDLAYIGTGPNAFDKMVADTPIADRKFLEAWIRTRLSYRDPSTVTSDEGLIDLFTVLESWDNPGDTADLVRVFRSSAFGGIASTGGLNSSVLPDVTRGNRMVVPLLEQLQQAGDSDADKKRFRDANITLGLADGFCSQMFSLTGHQAQLDEDLPTSQYYTATECMDMLRQYNLKPSNDTGSSAKRGNTTGKIRFQR